MGRRYQPENVLQASVARLEEIYAQGHRVVVSFSGGKDSTAVLECAVIAARRTGRLPVEAVIRDEELGWPGHYEYCERMLRRKSVRLTWIVARQPHSFALSREQPFWWAFDPRFEQHWMRRYPRCAEEIQEITIEAMNTAQRYPPPPGKNLVTPIGIRAGESRNRMLGVYSMGGWLTGEDSTGRIKAWPIYDWTEKDVWRAIVEMKWDHASGYGDLYRGGVRGSQLRMGAFMNRFGIKTLPAAKRIWPRWFGRLALRFPEVSEAVRRIDTVARPQRHVGETWEACFERTCIRDAPAWISARSAAVLEQTMARHSRHSTAPFSDDAPCKLCGSGRESWRSLAEGMFMGDPFSEFSASGLPYVEPQQFRPELAGTPAGTWGGHPG